MSDEEEEAIVRRPASSSRLVADDDDAPRPAQARKRRAVNDDDESDEEPAGDDVHAAHPSDEEESDGEVTEADRRFVADDEEEEEGDGEAKSRRRHKKKKKRSRDFELEDEDRELVEENLGLRQDTSRSRGSSEKTLEQALFEDDEEETPASTSKGQATSDDEESDEEGSSRARKATFDDDDDDLDGFIEQDEDEERAAPRPRRRVADNVLADLGLVDPQQLEEWGQIFGNMDEIDEEIRGLMQDEDKPEEEEGAAREPNIQEVIEPSLLAKKHFTAEDDRIRATDLPERTQLLHRSRQAPVSSELEQEALWITQNPNIAPNISDRQAVRTAVQNVLKFIRVENYEVPFIYNYRQDYFVKDDATVARFYSTNLQGDPPLLLTRQDLWEIVDLDTKWRHIVERKIKALDILRSADRSSYMDTLLAEMNGEHETRDLLNYVTLLHGRRESSTVTARSLKLASLEVQREALREFVITFSLTGEQLGNNLRLLTFAQRGDLTYPPEPRDAPEIAAEAFTSERDFPTPLSVLRASRIQLATDLAADPVVRKTLRDVFLKNATLSTRPTKSTKASLDATHPAAKLLYIEHKPLADVTAQDFLQIMRAERDGLLTYTFTQPSEEQSGVPDLLRRAYLSPRLAIDSSKAWNALRAMILHEMLNGSLQQHLTEYVRTCTTQRAHAFVEQAVSRELAQRLRVGSMIQHPTDPLDKTTSEAHLVAVTWDTSSYLTTVVAIDEDGAPVASLLLTGLRARTRERGSEASRKAKEADVEQLVEFILTHSPSAVGIGASGMQSRALQDELRAVLEEVKKQDSEVTPTLWLLEDDVARFYADKETTEFRDQTRDYRYCVALARTLLDPLQTIAGVWGSHSEYNFMQLDQHQDSLPRDRLRTVMTRGFCDVTAEVGVDLIAALRHPFWAGTLPFVSGLGPRKAAALLTTIQQKHHGQIYNRQQLVTANIVGVRVFLNCAAFLRLRKRYLPTRKGQVLRDIEYDLLDSTRIHPESYELARKIVTDALEIEQEPDAMNPSAQVEAMWSVRDETAKLDLLALADFASELQRRNRWERLPTMELIRFELKDPFHDRRPRPVPLSAERLFYLLVNESPSSFHVGTILPVTVVNVPRQDSRSGDDAMPVLVRLDNGTNGSIPQHLFPGEPFKLVENAVTEAVVTRILFDVFSVRLTASPEAISDSKRNAEANLRHLRFFNWDQWTKDEAASKKKRGQSQRTPYVARLFAHSRFRNCTVDEAQADLATQPVGAMLVRPSTRGAAILVATIKLAEDVYTDIEITEHNKKQPWLIGSSLQIGDDRFDDLDEALARHFNPLIDNYLAMTQFRKFVHAPREALMERCHREYTDKSTPYYFCLSRARTGSFEIVYQISKTPRFEFVGVTPNGFRLRYSVNKREFATPLLLTEWFKRHAKDANVVIPARPMQQPTHHMPPQQPRMPQQPMMPQAPFMPFHVPPAMGGMYVPPPMNVFAQGFPAPAPMPQFPMQQPYGAPPMGFMPPGGLPPFQQAPPVHFPGLPPTFPPFPPQQQQQPYPHRGYDDGR